MTAQKCGRCTQRAVSVSDPPQEDWFQFMQNARKKMEEAGCHFMSENEVQDHIGWLREGDRIDDLLRDSQKPENP
jgi:hypothetical protein